MLTALKDGFHAVFYSKTHITMPKVLHQSQGIRLVLSNGMIVIFNGNTVHSGGKSRIDSNGNLSQDRRLFNYIWSLRLKTSREDATEVYRNHLPLCSHYCLNDSCCDLCKNGVGTVLDLSKIDISCLNIGTQICGDLETLGWVVVKGCNADSYLEGKINKVANNGPWNRIGRNHCGFMKFINNSFTPNHK